MQIKINKGNFPILNSKEISKCLKFLDIIMGFKDVTIAEKLDFTYDQYPDIWGGGYLRFGGKQYYLNCRIHDIPYYNLIDIFMDLIQYLKDNNEYESFINEM